MKPINTLSLFDGKSCGRIALEKAGIKLDKYYSCEVDPFAIKAARHAKDSVLLAIITSQTLMIPDLNYSSSLSGSWMRQNLDGFFWKMYA